MATIILSTEEADKFMESNQSKYVVDWDFLDDGKVQFFLREGWREK